MKEKEGKKEAAGKEDRAREQAKKVLATAQELEKGRRYDNAAQLYLRVGDAASAKRCYIAAAEELKGHGDYGAAGVLLEQAGWGLQDHGLFDASSKMYAIKAQATSGKYRERLEWKSKETQDYAAQLREAIKKAHESPENKKGLREPGDDGAEEGGLVAEVAAGIIGFFGLGVGLFFLIPSMTGYVVSELAYKNSTWMGVIAFIIGLICSFYFFEKRKKKFR